MAVETTELLGAMMDPESRIAEPRPWQKAADETNSALSKANDALQTGQVTLELAKDVEPLMTQMKAMAAKLELLDERLQAIEKIQSSCSIM
jgi:hypothetical protein